MLTLDEVKQYLHLDSDAEDDYINILILLAAEMCENYTRLPLPETLPESYKQAMLEFGSDKPDLRNPLRIIDL